MNWIVDSYNCICTYLCIPFYCHPFQLTWYIDCYHHPFISYTCTHSLNNVFEVCPGMSCKYLLLLTSSDIMIQLLPSTTRSCFLFTKFQQSVTCLYICLQSFWEVSSLSTMLHFIIGILLNKSISLDIY